MTAVTSITQEQVMTAVRAFILSLISCEVVQTLNNNVPMPAQPFIALTEMSRIRLSTNLPGYDGTANASSEAHWQVTFQIDCYGPLSADWAAIIASMWRDPYAVDALAPVCAPLNADDPVQIPVVDAEANFEQRWLIRAVLQYNPIISTPMQSFTAAQVTPIIAVDVFYP